MVLAELPSFAGSARKLRGSSSRNRPLRSKSAASTAVAADVDHHGRGEVEPLALGDDRGNDVVGVDPILHLAEVLLAFLGAGGGPAGAARFLAGALRVRFLVLRAALGARQGALHQLLP